MSKIITLAGLSTFWAKVKSYIDNSTRSKYEMTGVLKMQTANYNEVVISLAKSQGTLLPSTAACPCVRLTLSYIEDDGSTGEFVLVTAGEVYKGSEKVEHNTLSVGYSQTEDFLFHFDDSENRYKLSLAVVSFNQDVWNRLFYKIEILDAINDIDLNYSSVTSNGLSDNYPFKKVEDTDTLLLNRVNANSSAIDANGDDIRDVSTAVDSMAEASEEEIQNIINS